MLEGEEGGVYNIYYDNSLPSTYSRVPLTKMTKLIKSVTLYIIITYAVKMLLTKALTIIDKSIQRLV